MKIQVIRNPEARKGRSRFLETALREEFGNALVSIEQTRSPEHATEIARKSVRKNVDTLVVVGGDGTINRVLNGLIGTDVALGIIPAGTANDLASLYRIPANARAACRVILRRKVHQVDLIRVNDWNYVTAGGLGLPCTVAKMANDIKSAGIPGKLMAHIFGSQIYVLALLLALFKGAKEQDFVKVAWNGQSLLVDMLWLMADNQPFLGKNFFMSPFAMNNDGLFDVCLAENPKSRSRVLSIVLKVLSGNHIALPGVKTGQTGELTIEAGRPMTFLGDGEVLEGALKFKIRSLPRALNLIVPDFGDSVGNTME